MVCKNAVARFSNSEYTWIKWIVLPITLFLPISLYR
ncbi:MAG: hypothetical protein K0Q94_5120 [Paenibacillus sp.]|jgi:hypothetical protein|nr:hypothetical protein [Paenibacillus sp.]